MKKNRLLFAAAAAYAVLFCLSPALRAEEWREERWMHEEVHRGIDRDWGLSWDCCSPYIGFGAGTGGRVGAGVGIGFPLGLEAERRSRRPKGAADAPRVDEYVVDPFAEDDFPGARRSNAKDAPAWERLERGGVIDPFADQN